MGVVGSDVAEEGLEDRSTGKAGEEVRFVYQGREDEFL